MGSKLGNLEQTYFFNVPFQDVVKSEKTAKCETKEYHKNALEKAKSFLDPTKSLTHDKKSNENNERNINIIKIIIEPVLFCAEQGKALRGHIEQGKILRK